MLYLLWDRKIYFSQKNQCFWSRFFILNVCFFQPHIHSCLSYRPLTSNACTLYYLIDYRIFNTFECCFTLTIHTNGGGGNFSQFWTHIGSWSCEWYEVSGKSTCTSKLQKKTRIWNNTGIPIKMSIIHLWCKDASWSLIVCALLIWMPRYSCIQHDIFKLWQKPRKGDSLETSSEDGTMTDSQLKSAPRAAICYHKIMALSDEDTWSCWSITRHKPRTHWKKHFWEIVPVS